MHHVSHLRTCGERVVGGKPLLARATGRFYTPELIAEKLVSAVVEDGVNFCRRDVRVVDPFCGDGRLIVAFLRKAVTSPQYRNARFFVSFWDTDGDAVAQAEAALERVVKELRIRAHLDARQQDTFLNSTAFFDSYDIVLTNPPWEALKPDRRELDQLDPSARSAFEKSLREYDLKLATLLPHSQPKAKFAGWGTNLSRCGLELSILLAKSGGHCGIVLPSSLFSDLVSAPLRRWVFHEATPLSLFHFPAEAKLFEGVDQPCVCAVFAKLQDHVVSPTVYRFDASKQLIDKDSLEISEQDLSSLGYGIPLDLSAEELRFLLRLQRFPELDSYAMDEPDGLWMGRELDETGYKAFVCDRGDIPFVKGRRISRFATVDRFEEFLCDGKRQVPESARHARVVWRDVSRRSQIRRMIATIIPADCVTGNSLQVAYFKDDDLDKLHALLGILSSIPFEFQLRSKLGTGHVSLGAVRQVRVPRLEDAGLVRSLSTFARQVLAGDPKAEVRLEVAVARALGFEHAEYGLLLSRFERLPEAFREELLKAHAGDSSAKRHPTRFLHSDIAQPGLAGVTIAIPNHYTAKLSKLDLQIARAVPPGGNWKNIPKHIPSKRLEQIRESFAAGEGSRSTYYGRLHPDRPSYTINTYFNRPGNGCHLHYDSEGGQDRVLSEREAARLQSFPDDFIFLGSHASIHKQIGNAVPPLLAYHIAKKLPVTGQYVDLFSGAGGISLGFKWAGWRPIVANDIEDTFLETYKHNIHQDVVVGDIRERHVFRKIVQVVQQNRKHDLPLLVVGGPPCQGFSTAGNRRSLADERNHLFNEFKALVETIKPDGFVFENVTGLLNMDRGAVFEMIRKELRLFGNPLVPWVLNAEEYGIPQRRTRLFLLSLPKAWSAGAPPAALTGMEADITLFGRTAKAVSVRDALSDLPPLSHGEDGSFRQYVSEPQYPYQALMRSRISVDEYLTLMRCADLAPSGRI